MDHGPPHPQETATMSFSWYHYVIIAIGAVLLVVAYLMKKKA